jgi:hypothetical protein
MHAPFGLKLWLLLSAIVVLWDSAFVLLQPRTFAGGDLHWIFSAYDLYSTVDKAYSREAYEQGETFPRAQAVLNLVEVSLQLYALFLFWVRRDNPKGVLVGFSCQLMTLAKTVLYFTMDAMAQFKHSRHNPILNLILLYVLPNSLWIVFPAIAVNHFGKQLLKAATANNDRKLK